MHNDVYFVIKNFQDFLQVFGDDRGLDWFFCVQK